jgi:enterochelin esterase family protein
MCRSAFIVFCASAVFALAALPATGLTQPAQQPRLISPELAANGDVTFRIRAPAADSVGLVSGGDIPNIPFGGGLALTKAVDGVWQTTIEALGSGAYRYTFNVDGVNVLDPSNRHTSESNANAWSLFYVPGAEFMDTQRVQHGAVAEVTYYSSILGRDRRMHVYTPPGYELDNDRYPVFYLLHGALDSDDSWSTVGRANFILDNLIAAGKAQPMIVVMPDGHTAPFTMGASGLPLAEFADEFSTDIKPLIESSYRVRTGRADTAIAGLSMGGAHTLEIAMAELDEYAYIGVYSSGVFTVNQDDSWQKRYQSALTDDAAKRGLELFWFSTGSEDFLLDTSQATVAMLESHGFDVEYDESTGGHTWINWREYLNAFAPRLFH